MMKSKLPIILYEEPNPGEPANPIPYVEVSKNEEMPVVLFISEYKETGEHEVDVEKGSVPIVDMIIHKFVDMEHLKEKLDEETNDKVRVALGMKPLKEAQASGGRTMDRVFQAADKRLAELKINEEARSERAFVLGEGLRQKAKKYLDEETKKGK